MPRRLEVAIRIYRYVADKNPPPANIASEAIHAYYPRADDQTVTAWACQVLCMIAEYHLACVT